MSDRENRSRPVPAGSGTGGGPLADSGAGAGFEAVLAAAAYDGIGGLAPPADLRRLGWGRPCRDAAKGGSALEALRADRVPAGHAERRRRTSRNDPVAGQQVLPVRVDDREHLGFGELPHPMQQPRLIS
jgi:hypothetical protein